MKTTYVLFVAEIPDPMDLQACKHWSLFVQFAKEHLDKAASVEKLSANSWLLPLRHDLRIAAGCISEASNRQIPFQTKIVSLD